MGSRVTLISFIEKTELLKIEKIIEKTHIDTCKVPYGINDNNRYAIDNLPFHFTIFATDKINQDELLRIAKSINIKKLKVRVNDVKIMKGKYDSYILYLSIDDNREIKELQKVFFDNFLEEKYNPEKFIFHITLHIDKDYQTILELQNSIKKEFKPFYLEFDKLALYDYPGDMIELIM